MASISRLFSESSIPYLDYRLTENLFCKYYNAQNDARSCTAYDARLSNLGIGIKTFGIKAGHSVEKIAEFNKLKPKLDGLRGVDLARKISLFRNERMEFSNNTYDVFETQYHIVGRQEGCLKIFNTPYDMVHIDNICDIEDKEASISFNDGINEYSFNKSKSVLLRRFDLPTNNIEIPVNILGEPLELLAQLLHDNYQYDTLSNTKIILAPSETKGVDYVILPLYSKRGGVPTVQEKSGLNQWNAGGRRRDDNEVYIPIPKSIHKLYPNFFPNRDCPFELILPNGESLSAKVCQEGGKALMSNPNSALGEWILRKVLRKPIGALVTIDDLNTYGIDSVKITDTHKNNLNGESVFKIEFSNSAYEDYSAFIE
ncbi:MAG: NgoFVII family restriction endonuclease [Alistipes sp.]|nr:NgoFVII family restriction endonuclease [Alistipes sp.]